MNIEETASTPVTRFLVERRVAWFIRHPEISAEAFNGALLRMHAYPRSSSSLGGFIPTTAVCHLHELLSFKQEYPMSDFLTLSTRNAQVPIL